MNLLVDSGAIHTGERAGTALACSVRVYMILINYYDTLTAWQSLAVILDWESESFTTQLLVYLSRLSICMVNQDWTLKTVPLLSKAPIGCPD